MRCNNYWASARTGGASVARAEERVASDRVGAAPRLLRGVQHADGLGCGRRGGRPPLDGRRSKRQTMRRSTITSTDITNTTSVRWRCRLAHPPEPSSNATATTSLCSERKQTVLRWCACVVSHSTEVCRRGRPLRLVRSDVPACSTRRVPAQSAAIFTHLAANSSTCGGAAGYGLFDREIKRGTTLERFRERERERQRKREIARERDTEG